jgi:hypothetical protein
MCLHPYRPAVAFVPTRDHALEIANPGLVFEMLSPGNAVTDVRDRLQGYFRVASI